jgi:hypothetical protein
MDRLIAAHGMHTTTGRRGRRANVDLFIMRVEQAMATDELATAIVPTGAPQRLSLRLRIARLAWVLVALLAVLTFLPGVLPWYHMLVVPVPNVAIAGTQLSLADAAGLQRLGWPIEVYADFIIAITLVSGLSFWLVALFIFMRRRGDGTALLASFVLLVAGANRLFALLLASARSSGPLSLLALPGLVVNSLALPLLIIFLFYFPDGRCIPAWARLPVIAGAASIFLWDTATFSWGGPLDGLLTYVLLAAGILAQIYRYVRVADQTQRQRVKWVFWASVISIPVIVEPGSGVEALVPAGSFVSLVLFPLLLLLETLIPIGVGISILRYRLYDIDVIINRTLVYVPLTAILAGLYAALIALLQRLSQALTGQTSDAAVVLTTLILTASFTPIKNGLQSFVDKRFKGGPSDTERLKALGHEVEQRIYALDVAAVTRRLLDMATAAFNTGGALYLQGRGGKWPAISYSTDGWQDSQAQVTVPLQAADGEMGKLLLGNRLTGRSYTEKDIETLRKAVAQIAAAIQRQ